MSEAREGEYIERGTFDDIDKAAGNEWSSDPAQGAPGDGGADPGAGREALAGCIGGALALVFRFVAERRGPHWQLSAEEATEAGAAYADLVQHYFPGAGGGPLTAALLVSAGLMAPRIMLEQMQQAREADAEGATSGAQS